MRFFFLPELPPKEGAWPPPKDLHRHLRALRLQPGEEVLLLTEEGMGRRARILASGQLEMLGGAPRPELDLLPVTLLSAWPKGPRAEELVRRATEHGVADLFPLLCRRSILGRSELPDNRLQRWRRIALETCSQCRRPDPPRLHGSPIGLQDARNTAPDALPVVLSPGAPDLWSLLEERQPSSILLAVGPEGGFCDEEQQEMEGLGFLAAGIGPSILRIEAAGPFAVGLCQQWATARSAR